MIQGIENHKTDGEETEQMRVLHLLASGGIGGIETLIRNYAEYSQNENVFLFVYDGGIIADELEAMNQKVVHTPAELNGNIAKLKWILKCCKDFQPQAIITHHSSPIFKVALACVKMRMPQIRRFAYAHANAVDICGVGYKGYEIRRLVHRIGFGAAQGVVAISHAVKDSLITILKVKKEKILVLHNAVALPGEPCLIEAFHEKIRLIYVGRLIPEKGVQTIINALSYGDLKEKVHLTIVGDGGYRSELERLACELHLEKTVDFVGTQRNVHPYLDNADIFVHCPEWEEGFGLTVIEAMGHGLLCVCSDNGALSELIADGENGFHVTAHSPKALSEKIEWILKHNTDTGSFAEIRNNAHRYAQGFNVEMYTQKLEEYLRKGGT